MFRNLLLFIALLPFCSTVKAQNSIFDQNRVNSVYIEINADSLDYIMNNVLSEHYFMARFIYVTDDSRDTIENAGFRLRGNTSRYSQKKSYKISFNEYESGRRYQGVKKINLNGEHNDPSMIREKLFYDLWNKSGMPERRSSFVRLYINGEYRGLYTNLEEFDKDWALKVYGENDGNLYKCTYPASMYYWGTDQQFYKDILSTSVTGGRAYDLQTNETEDDYSDLVQLISTLDLPPDSAFMAAISNLINVDEVLKAFAWDVATGNWDDYMFNQNNYYLYHTQSGKFEFISYDTDNTFGVDWMNIDWATRDCIQWYSNSGSRPLVKKLLAIPEYDAKYRAFLDTIARVYILPDSVFPQIDRMKALISAAAIEDHDRTLDFGYDVADFNNSFDQSVDNHTPYGIKPFLLFRKTKILEQLSGAGIKNPFFSKKEGITLSPNPAGEQINLKLSNPGKNPHYHIMDQSGKIWSEGNIPAGSEPFTISLAGLPPGMYIMQVQNGSKSYSKKIIRK